MLLNRHAARFQAVTTLGSHTYTVPKRFISGLFIFWPFTLCIFRSVTRANIVSIDNMSKFVCNIKKGLTKDLVSQSRGLCFVASPAPPIFRTPVLYPKPQTEATTARLISIGDHINITGTLQPQQQCSSVYTSFAILLMRALPRHPEPPILLSTSYNASALSYNKLQTESHVQPQLPSEICADPHRPDPSSQSIVI